MHFLLQVMLLAGEALPAGCVADQRTPDQTFSLSPDIFLNYTVAEKEGAEVLVGIHGFGASLDTWHDIAPLLESHYQLYMLDMVGFGLSARPPGFNYTIREQAEVVASFVQFVQKETGGRPITLVGHSFGGSVAIATNLVLKERNRPIVSRLILIDALAYPKQVHFPPYINILRVPIANRLVLNVMPANFIARYVLNHVFYRRALVTQERVCRYAQFYDLPGSHRALIETAKGVGQTEDIEWLSHAISDIDVPTLIIWGIHDPLIPAKPQAGLLHNAIATSQDPKFLETGHVAHEELPSEAAALIQAFLK